MSHGPNTPDICWYLIRTRPRQELRAEANLNAYGVETLAPKVHDPHASADSANDRATPLFPGYIFVRFDPATLLSKVRNTRGVRSVVGFGEGATPVEDTVIALIQSRVRGDGFVHVGAPKRGETVEIVAGPLRSLHGIFERELHAPQRVLILLSAIGGQTRVQVPRTFIRAASTVPAEAV